MGLTLTVLSFKNRPINEIGAVSIGEEGGSIGRSDDNALVLPDTEKFVSRHHATIKVENGCYYLSDTSLGGVIINGDNLPLHNATVRIDNGTRLKIGEYEIMVAITASEPIIDDFPFTPEPITQPTISAFLAVDEPWVDLDSMTSNSLMTDNFPSHDELIQQEANAHAADFKSHLAGNQSPLFDNYIAPNIIPSASPSSDETIPENFSFDDLFSANDMDSPTQVTNKPAAYDDFEDFFGAAIGEMVTGNAAHTEQNHENNQSFGLFADNEAPIEQALPIELAKKTLVSETFIENHQDVDDLANFFASNESPIEQSPSNKPEKNALINENIVEYHQDVDNLANFFAGNEQASPNEPTEKTLIDETPVKHHQNSDDLADIFVSNEAYIEQHSAVQHEAHHIDIHKTTNSPNDNKHISESVSQTEAFVEKTSSTKNDSILFDEFLQGVAVECSEIQSEHYAETLHRIGQMFRKLIDGTVAVLRSRAEFKSLCRVNMTVIRAADNNPLKFTISTDDVLRQLLENKSDGFLPSTVAIEEAFNDIMNHQLAMQAGIQASLTDLLRTFDPQIIEKQFEQGLVLQKKSKCWDKYEEIYNNTVENAVENFFGEEFVKAYEKQMSLLTNTRKKS